MSNEAKETLDDNDLLSTRGQLSSRMQKEGTPSVFTVTYT